jgi:hypothetical protein
MGDELPERPRWMSVLNRVADLAQGPGGPIGFGTHGGQCVSKSGKLEQHNLGLG